MASNQLSWWNRMRGFLFGSGLVHFEANLDDNVVIRGRSPFVGAYSEQAARQHIFAELNAQLPRHERLASPNDVRIMRVVGY